MRHPGRTAVTASALMIGVALVTVVTVVANGLRQETKGSLDDRIAASHVITEQDGWSPMDPQVARTAAGVPGVTAVSALRQDGGLVAGDKEVVNGVDGATIGKVFDFDVEGRLQPRPHRARGRRRGGRRRLGDRARPRRSATRSRSPR